MCYYYSAEARAGEVQRGNVSDFSPRKAKNNLNPFFSRTCASEKTLLTAQVCEASHASRVRAAPCFPSNCLVPSGTEQLRKNSLSSQKEVRLFFINRFLSLQNRSAHYVARPTIRLLCRRRPTSNLSLASRVQVPIPPMGAAHLRV